MFSVCLYAVKSSLYRADVMLCSLLLMLTLLFRAKRSIRSAKSSRTLNTNEERVEFESSFLLFLLL